MANVTIIPPRERTPDTLRVAAYCRVSTDLTEQATSYASQIRNYTELISRHEGWELVDIYADESASGTKMDKRDDFNRLLSDCRKGKIDRVLVKSISRFARNTKDCLAALRELTRLGVTVQFEKENIDTGTLTTELMVSVSGSLAQQESVSISQNIRMGYRRRMERGEFIANKPPYGYRNAGNGTMEIVPEEAEVIRWVYRSYLNGHSPRCIAAEMNRRGIDKKYGESAWTKNAVTYWLQNEKYIGDALCQKTFTSGFPFTKRMNQGEADQFYIENCLPAIISRDMFERVQVLREQKKMQGPAPGKYPLSRKIICGKCGATLERKVCRLGKVSWICARHNSGRELCPSAPVHERDICTAFIRMYNKLKLHEGIILQPAINQLEGLEDALRRKNPAILEINQEIAAATERSYKISKLRNGDLLDADAYAAQLAANNARLTQLRAKRRRLLQNDDIADAVEAIRQTVDTIRQGAEQLTAFDEVLFETLTERITAESAACFRFRLRGGIEVTERLGRDTE